MAGPAKWLGTHSFASDLRAVPVVSRVFSPRSYPLPPLGITRTQGVARGLLRFIAGLPGGFRMVLGGGLARQLRGIQIASRPRQAASSWSVSQLCAPAP